MDNALKKYLENLNIKYEIYSHPAVFTVQESKEITKHIPGIRTKNLFLESKNRFYLVSLPGEKRLDMKKLKIQLSVKDLHFASPENLKIELNLTPGSVSIFGMIYAKNTLLILDKEIWDAEFSGFHPNINTETILIDHENLKRFYDSLTCEKKIINL